MNRSQAALIRSRALCVRQGVSPSRTYTMHTTAIWDVYCMSAVQLVV